MFTLLRSHDRPVAQKTSIHLTGRARRDGNVVVAGSNHEGTGNSDEYWNLLQQVSSQADSIGSRW